jgi:myo-inositol-1(or 4)-monophosphatase
MTIRTPIMNVMTAAARKAARSLRRDFGEVEALQVSKKGPADFVSAADERVEHVLFAELSRARPSYGFLMEERGAVEGADKAHRFIVDPLDGTTNFLHGIPHFAISIGLEREGQLIAGVVFSPFTDEMFIAEKGQGAWLNERRLRVSTRSAFGECVIATGVPFKGRPGHDLFRAELASLTDEIAGIRRFGSAALDLAWVAAGRYDGFWERNLSPWDIAAGIVLVREAGGYVTDLAGKEADAEHNSILAANPALHPQLLERLASAGRLSQHSAKI